jgi:hypothetical protein
VNAFQTRERCPGDNELCSTVFFLAEEVDERLDDKVLFVLNGLTRELARNVDNGQPGVVAAGLVTCVS